MRLYYADIRGLDEKDARYPALSRRRGSAFGVSLLAAAYEDYAGPQRPDLRRLFRGKSLLPDRPQYHYSVSHSKTHVFLALSDKPVGVDTEPHRPLKQSFIEKLTTPAERACFGFFDTWVLRESFYKLTGRGDLRSLRFYRRAARIIAPEPEVFCRLYGDIPGSSAAVACYDGAFPDKLIELPPETLLSDEARRRCQKEKAARKP
jgi:phosphopantetheinyl transferase